MLAGFGTLTTLKRELLLPAEAATSSRDDAVLDMGRGVAGLIERYCGRAFLRKEGDVRTFPGIERMIGLRRYPVEAVTSVELRSSVDEGYVVVDGQPLNFDPDSGIVKFGYSLGGDYSVGRITWTGGYWIDPTDDGSDTMPADAVELPYDLKLAWLLQAKNLWDQRNLIDRAKAGVRSGEGLLGGETKIIPVVADMLAPYRRMIV